jgi:hypothetical protein
MFSMNNEVAPVEGADTSRDHRRYVFGPQISRPAIFSGGAAANPPIGATFFALPLTVCGGLYERRLRAIPLTPSASLSRGHWGSALGPSPFRPATIFGEATVAAPSGHARSASPNLPLGRAIVPAPSGQSTIALPRSIALQVRAEGKARVLPPSGQKASALPTL